MVQCLFDRPGFQQDPVADTADDTIIGAHCSCPTRLNGFGVKPEPFDLVHHHGNRDAVPRTLWKKGQRVTCVDLLPGAGANRKSRVLISVGTVVDNMEVPPSGGCVVSVKVKFDSNQEVLSFPGFHQIFFYGDYGHQLRDFCQLCGFEVQVVWSRAVLISRRRNWEGRTTNGFRTRINTVFGRIDAIDTVSATRLRRGKRAPSNEPLLSSLWISTSIAASLRVLRRRP